MNLGVAKRKNNISIKGKAMKTRTKGLIKFIIGSMAYAIVFSTFLNQDRETQSHGIYLTSILIALPGILTITGLIELISGIEITQISHNWDDLKGWQRGILGVIICIFAFAIMIGIGIYM